VSARTPLVCCQRRWSDPAGVTVAVS